MWLIGLVIGALVGVVGEGAGAVIGAVVGGIAGWLISDARKSADDRYAKLETIIRHLSERVSAIEERSAASRTTDGAAAKTEERPEPTTTTPIITPPPSTEIAGAPVEAGSSLEIDDPSLPSEPSSRPSAPRAPEPESLPRAFPPAPAQASALWNFFFGGNTLARFGVIVLFFGVAFLLKYASEHIEISIEARLIGVALGALYLTVFAAFRLYQLLPAGLVFVLLAAMAVFSAMLAVQQDSRSLAAMGVSGGFLAPILASTGGGSHVALFSFYALLNFGILLIAWFKAWRSLTLLGFSFTFIIGLFWGGRYYRAELF